MTTEFTLIILYLILALPLVLVFMARAGMFSTVLTPRGSVKDEIDRQEIEEYDLEKSDVD